MIDKRNKENTTLRKLVTAGAVMARKLDGQGTSESQAIATAWDNLLQKAREQNLLGVTESQ